MNRCHRTDHITMNRKRTRDHTESPNSKSQQLSVRKVSVQNDIEKKKKNLQYERTEEKNTCILKLHVETQSHVRNDEKSKFTLQVDCRNSKKLISLAKTNAVRKSVTDYSDHDQRILRDTQSVNSLKFDDFVRLVWIISTLSSNPLWRNIRDYVKVILYSSERDEGYCILLTRCRIPHSSCACVTQRFFLPSVVRIDIAVSLFHCRFLNYRLERKQNLHSYAEKCINNECTYFLICISSH